MHLDIRHFWTMSEFTESVREVPPEGGWLQYHTNVLMHPTIHSKYDIIKSVWCIWYAYFCVCKMPDWLGQYSRAWFDTLNTDLSCISTANVHSALLVVTGLLYEICTWPGLENESQSLRSKKTLHLFSFLLFMPVRKHQKWFIHKSHITTACNLSSFSCHFNLTSTPEG